MLKKMSTYKKFLFFILSSSFFHYLAFTQELVNIGILGALKLSSIKILFQDAYSVQFDEANELQKLNKNQFYQLEVINDSLVLMDNLNGKKITAKTIRFFSPDITNSEFSIIHPKLSNSRTYKGHLTITAKESNLQLVNTLELDDYVCGVVNAEVGKGRHPELYKAQSLLVRTYALSHLYKHLPEGYNLCDQVHCQVYYGTCQSSSIFEAVKSTHHLIIVDKDLNLIVAAFHSNSGGQTVNSEDIWGSKKEYLRSVKDTFSIGMPSYRWQKKIALAEWIRYLKKYKYPVDDSEALNFATNFKQYNRNVYLHYNHIKIPLKNIREELKLMSTFFDISLNATKDTVIFSGRGFGHGVGLSQEGAMKMAKLGLNYKQIINFYYQNVILIDLKKLNFFKEE